MMQARSKLIAGTGSWFLVLLLFTVWLPLGASASMLYRYKNSDGVTVMDQTIPPEYVNNGYEVLSKSGRVVKVVPPYTEKAAGTSEQDEKARLQREKDDQYLLANFRSLEEIQYSKARKLGQLKREIHIVEANLADTLDQRENQLASAASFQASGREVPESVRATLAKLEQEEDKARDMLATRRQEYEALDKRFQAYESRFLELTDTQKTGDATSGNSGS